MNLQETLKYMEAQIPLKEGQLDKQFRILKANLKQQNPQLNNEELDNQVAQKLVASGQFPGMDAQAILKTIRQNTTYGKYIADSKNLQGNAAMNAYEDAQATGHTNVKIAPIQKNSIQQYYSDIKTGEDLKNRIDSFNNQLSTQLASFESVYNQLLTISQSAKANGAQTTNLDKAIENVNQQLPAIKNNDTNSKNIFKGIGSLLKGILNTGAGMLGNFIGGVASGMGAAK